jgi:hypothetical protein
MTRHAAAGLAMPVTAVMVAVLGGVFRPAVMPAEHAPDFTVLWHDRVAVPLAGQPWWLETELGHVPAGGLFPKPVQTIMYRP